VKTITKTLFLLFTLFTCYITINGTVPNVFLNEKFPMPKGETMKIAYSDHFTTNLNGENVTMRIMYYSFKKVPSLTFEIFTKESNLFQNFYNYITKLDSVIDKFKYTGKRICDIRLNDTEWMMIPKYAVGGSSLYLVRASYDDLSPNHEDCISIIFPLSFMDSNLFNWNGKPHTKELLKFLSEGNGESIHYYFYNPEDGNKKVYADLPLNSDISLTIQKLIKAYK